MIKRRPDKIYSITQIENIIMCRNNKSYSYLDKSNVQVNISCKPGRHNVHNEK